MTSKGNLITSKTALYASFLSTQNFISKKSMTVPYSRLLQPVADFPCELPGVINEKYNNFF